MSNTPAQAEATAETVEFEHFDRKWHPPSKVRLSHQRKLRELGASDVSLVDTFLPADEIKALDALDPTADELDEFTDAMMVAMGLKSAGNS